MDFIKSLKHVNIPMYYLIKNTKMMSRYGRLIINKTSNKLDYKHISTYLSDMKHIHKLKYGLNPNNHNAGYFFKGPKSFDVLNGDLSYINVLDAMLGWNLVNEAKNELGMDTCASYKHNAPAGVSCFGDTSHNIIKSARNCDSLSSFGDFISYSGKLDSESASYLKTEVSDGIIASDYTDRAIDILRKRKR